jgi:hypothetical protein
MRTTTEEQAERSLHSDSAPLQPTACPLRCWKRHRAAARMGGLLRRRLSADSGQGGASPLARGHI